MRREEASLKASLRALSTVGFMFYFLSIDLVSISPPTTDERKTQPHNDARRGARRRAQAAAQQQKNKNNHTCCAFIYNKNAPNNEAQILKLELQKEPDGGSNAESGSSNPVIKPKPRA